MVSLGTGLNLGIIAVVGLTILLLVRNAGAIGSFIGSGLNQFGSNIIGGIEGVGAGITGAFVSTSEEQIVNTAGLQEQTEDVAGGGIGQPLSGINFGRLTFAQFLKQENLGGKINLRSGIFSNQFTEQPLDFTISRDTGNIRTGRIGLSDVVLQRQAALGKEFGIPTFDIKGNLSTFGGFVTGNQSTRETRFG